MRRARKSMPGTRCSNRRCCSLANGRFSSRASPRRRPKAAILTYASSTSGIWPAAPHKACRWRFEVTPVRVTKTRPTQKNRVRERHHSMPRVLIADDEDSMRSLVARAIAMDGHETVTAEDGAEALDILTREKGAFDLLLTDIQMPVMDGIALALAAARDFPDLTILLMTGFADQRERAHGLNAIAHDVITKPFSVADIRTAVADALAARKKG